MERQVDVTESLPSEKGAKGPPTGINSWADIADRDFLWVGRAGSDFLIGDYYGVRPK